MRIPRRFAVASTAATAAIIFAGIGLGAASASSRPVVKAVSAGALVPAKASAGWQQDFTFSVPRGTTNLFFHFPCPKAFPIADNGSYHPSKINPGTVISGSFPRTDIKPIHTQWGWVFGFPGGSPAGYKITFNAYCGKS